MKLIKFRVLRLFLHIFAVWVKIRTQQSLGKIPTFKKIKRGSIRRKSIKKVVYYLGV